MELCRIPASKWIATCSRCLKFRATFEQNTERNSIIDEDDENNDSYSERMIAERRVSITKRAAQAIAKAASNGSSSMPPDKIAQMLVTSKCLRLCSKSNPSLAGGKFINTPASGAKSTARVKNDEDGDHEISFLSLPKESRAAMVGACISLLNCLYLLPASTYARRTIWDAMFFFFFGKHVRHKWALERANEWNDLRAITSALRFAAALDDDTSLMTGRSAAENVDEEEQRHLSIQTSRDVAIAHVVAAAWSNGVDDEASMDRENYAVKEDDVLHAISAIFSETPSRLFVMVVVLKRAHEQSSGIIPYHFRQ